MTEVSQNVLTNDERDASFEQRERLAVSFDEYRQICDRETNEFRKIGIQDPAAYEKVVQDPRTVFAEYYGKTLPLLSPLECEKMYEFGRCKEMLDGRELMLLSLPLSTMNQLEVKLPDEIPVPEQGMGIITEQFDGVDDEYLNTLRFSSDTVSERHQFVNPLLENSPGHETSWMASYRYTLMPKNEEPRPYVGEGSLTAELMSSWEDLCVKKGWELLPGEHPEGTYLLSAEQLAGRPDIIDSLWSISEVGFGKILGAHHPVSMEFNRDFFDSQIVSEDTVTAVYYDEGEPVCFGFVGLGMHNNEWLNCDSDVLQRELAEAREKQQLYVHFYELISNGIKGMGYSTNIVGAFYELAANFGYETSVFFESTNLSATYIPAILEKQADESDVISLSRRVEMLGKLKYSALTVDRSSVRADEIDRP